MGGATRPIPVGHSAYHEYMDNPTHKASHIPFPKVPWKRPARDEAARVWRGEINPLVSVIQSTLHNALPGLIDPIGGLDRRAVRRTAEKVLYKPDADPADRGALIDWLGSACVVSDRRAQGNGLGPAHIFCGQLMTAWATKSWGGVVLPEWAQPLLQGVTRGGRDHGPVLTQKVVQDDLQTFLSAHRRQAENGAVGRLRNVAHDWNRDTANACAAWMLLACEAPERASVALVEQLRAFRQGYGVNTLHQDIQRQVLAAWERKILADFTRRIPGSGPALDQPAGQPAGPAARRTL